jgi:hypothetical protein
VAKAWLLAGLMALTFTAAGYAQETPPAVAAPPTIAAPTIAAPTIAAAETSQACIPGLTSAGERCGVVAAAGVNDTLTWALYEVRSPEGRYALSVILAPDAQPGRLKAAASIRAPGTSIDRWERSPYTAASIVKHGGADYVGMSIRGEEGPAAFSLHRIEGAALVAVDSSRLTAELQAKLGALSKPGCRVVSNGLDWRTFRLRYGLMNDDGSCGTAFLDLAVIDGAVKVADALVIR